MDKDNTMCDCPGGKTKPRVYYEQGIRFMRRVCSECHRPGRMQNCGPATSEPGSKAKPKPEAEAEAKRAPGSAKRAPPYVFSVATLLQKARDGARYGRIPAWIAGDLAARDPLDVYRACVQTKGVSPGDFSGPETKFVRDILDRGKAREAELEAREAERKAREAEREAEAKRRAKKDEVSRTLAIMLGYKSLEAKRKAKAAEAHAEDERKAEAHAKRERNAEAHAKRERNAEASAKREEAERKAAEASAKAERKRKEAAAESDRTLAIRLGRRACAYSDDGSSSSESESESEMCPGFQCARSRRRCRRGRRWSRPAKARSGSGAADALAFSVTEITITVTNASSAVACKSNSTAVAAHLARAA